MRTRQLLVFTLIALAAAAAMNAAVPAATLASTGAAAHSPVSGTGARYIVQASTLKAADRDVARVGAKSEQHLAIINAVSAYLNPWQVRRLRETAGVHVFEDRSLKTDGLLGLLSPVTTPVIGITSSLQTPQDGQGMLLPSLLYQTNYPMLVGADSLQKAGTTGKGVTI